MTLAPGSEIGLRIESLVAGGDGLARHDGRVVFVPLTAPGDHVIARVSRVRPRYARAELIRVERPGPGRRTPPCEHHARCGGCRWLHLEDAEQSRARVAIVEQALRRIGGFPELPAIEHVPSPRVLGYRSRARVAFADGRVGFRMRRSSHVVDIDHCAVLDQPTQRELAALRAHPPRGRGECEIRGFGRRAEGLRVSPGAFFQPNGALWQRWAELVADCCGRGEQIVELFAGVGFYTARLESRFERVVAVERGIAARDLRHNVRAEVVASSAERFVEDHAWRPLPDVVLLNPPRTGCAPLLMERLARVAPPRIVYVSCDAATLARDIACLQATHRIARLLVLDALPQTHHVEVITVIESS